MHVRVVRELAVRAQNWLEFVLMWLVLLNQFLYVWILLRELAADVRYLKGKCVVVLLA